MVAYDDLKTLMGTHQAYQEPLARAQAGDVHETTPGLLESYVRANANGDQDILAEAQRIGTSNDIRELFPILVEAYREIQTNLNNKIKGRGNLEGILGSAPQGLVKGNIKAVPISAFPNLKYFQIAKNQRKLVDMEYNLNIFESEETSREEKEDSLQNIAKVSLKHIEGFYGKKNPFLKAIMGYLTAKPENMQRFVLAKYGRLTGELQTEFNNQINAVDINKYVSGVISKDLDKRLIYFNSLFEYEGRAIEQAQLRAQRQAPKQQHDTAA